MTKLFKPLISFWRLWKKVKHPGFAYRLLPEVYTPNLQPASGSKMNHDELLSLHKKYSPGQLALFGNHGELLLKFLKSGNIDFEKKEGDKIVAVLFNDQKIRMHVSDYNNLQVINEIFINQVYDFHSNENYVVCDAGMNTGIASLYFASFHQVVKVYGYEPFLKTFERAKENLALNKELAKKIETFPFGLGNKNEQIEVPLPADGFPGGSTTADFINELPDELKKEKTFVEIKEISQVLFQIKQNHPDSKLILKLDCEGAEYEILEKLDQDNRIPDVAVYMLEFHYKGKKKLTDILLKHQYFIMSPVSEEINPFGMLYAIKLNS